MIVATLGVQPSLPRPALACIDPINRYSRKEADVKARVHIMLKQGVLDPQGEAVRHALGAMGFQGVEGVRQGKVIELDLAEGTGEPEIRDMCEKLLANTVIESYDIEFL